MVGHGLAGDATNRDPLSSRTRQRTVAVEMAAPATSVGRVVSASERIETRFRRAPAFVTRDYPALLGEQLPS